MAANVRGLLEGQRRFSQKRMKKQVMEILAAEPRIDHNYVGGESGSRLDPIAIDTHLDWPITRSSFRFLPQRIVGFFISDFRITSGV